MEEKIPQKPRIEVKGSPGPGLGLHMVARAALSEQTPDFDPANALIRAESSPYEVLMPLTEFQRLDSPVAPVSATERCSRTGALRVANEIARHGTRNSDRIFNNTMTVTDVSFMNFKLAHAEGQARRMFALETADADFDVSLRAAGDTQSTGLGVGEPTRCSMLSCTTGEAHRTGDFSLTGLSECSLGEPSSLDTRHLADASSTVFRQVLVPGDCVDDSHSGHDCARDRFQSTGEESPSFQGRKYKYLRIPPSLLDSSADQQDLIKFAKNYGMSILVQDVQCDQGFVLEKFQVDDFTGWLNLWIKVCSLRVIQMCYALSLEITYQPQMAMVNTPRWQIPFPRWYIPFPR